VEEVVRPRHQHHRQVLRPRPVEHRRERYGLVALAVMMLWEEGRFLLDDRVSRWLPAFAPVIKHKIIVPKLSLTLTTFAPTVTSSG